MRMNYRTEGNAGNYDLENILSIFGFEKTKEDADVVFSEIDGILKLSGSGVDFSAPLLSLSPNERKRRLYLYLSELFGAVTDWGILVGVRPVKIAAQMLRSGMSPEEVVPSLCGEYLLSVRSAELLTAVAAYEEGVAPVLPAAERSHRASLYVSVPFCPTRCRYCSFPMQPLTTKKKLLQPYFEKLRQELEDTLKMLADVGRRIDCIYFGGGTPSTLSCAMIEDLSEVMRKYIDFSRLQEFTFEAGRSDTITEELIRTLKRIGADRVSVNPQSFTAAALRESLRERAEGEFERAFFLAKDAGMKINSDIILGLDGESPEEYLRGLEYLVRMQPDNITVHALSLKRGSPLFGERMIPAENRSGEVYRSQAGKSPASACGADMRCADRSECSSSSVFSAFSEGLRFSESLPFSENSSPYALSENSAFSPSCASGDRVDRVASTREYLQKRRSLYGFMNVEGARILQNAGYRPYYLYRQKRILSNLENVGYTLSGKGCLYNSRMMSEHYDIFAVGTGGVSKVCFPAENRHEQIPGTRSVEDYIERFSKVSERIETVRRMLVSQET